MDLNSLVALNGASLTRYESRDVPRPPRDEQPSGVFLKLIGAFLKKVLLRYWLGSSTPPMT